MSSYGFGSYFYIPNLISLSIVSKVNNSKFLWIYIFLLHLIFSNITYCIDLINELLSAKFHIFKFINLKFNLTLNNCYPLGSHANYLESYSAFFLFKVK